MCWIVHSSMCAQPKVYSSLIMIKMSIQMFFKVIKFNSKIQLIGRIQVKLLEGQDKVGSEGHMSYILTLILSTD